MAKFKDTWRIIIKVIGGSRKWIGSSPRLVESSLQGRECACNCRMRNRMANYFQILVEYISSSDQRNQLQFIIPDNGHAVQLGNNGLISHLLMKEMYRDCKNTE
jgi:hypothetical protein